MTNSLNISRWQLAVIGLLLLTLFALAIAGSTAPDTVPYDPDARHDDGLLALRLWLQELGYETEETSRSTFAVPEQTNLFFSFPGSEPFSPDHAEHLFTWVQEGGTLVLVGPAPTDTDLASWFDISLQAGRSIPGQIRQLQPVLPDVPAAWSLYTTGPYLDLENAPSALPVLGIDEDRVTAAIRTLGHGHVWYLSPGHDLRNESLHDEQQAWLLPALLRTIPDEGRITFDAYHILGSTRYTPSEVDSLRTWFYSTPLGWSVLASIAVAFIYLLSQGIRLGPPLEATAAGQYRTPGEHVSALAKLQQRAHQHDAVAGYHRQRLVTHLMSHYQLSPNLSEAEMVARIPQQPALATHNPEHIAALLNELRKPRDDRHLVELVSQVDDVIAVEAKYF